MRPADNIRKGSVVYLATAPWKPLVVVRRVPSHHGRLKYLNLATGRWTYGPQVPRDRTVFACQDPDGSVKHVERRDLRKARKR